MSFLKNIDYFQKISFDIQKSTFIGAIVSIVSVSTMIILTLSELTFFLSPSLKKDAIIYNNDDNQFLNFSFIMKIYGSPCPLIGVLHADDKGMQYQLTENRIKMVRVSKNNQYLGSDYDHTFQTITKMFEESEQCDISGSIPMPQTPGTITFSPMNQRNIYYTLMNNLPDIAQSYSLRHKFTHIYFGGDHTDQKLLKKFGFDDLDLFNRATLPDFVDDKNVHFDYFIKIIPHILYDELWGTSTMTYQYSLSYLSRPNNPHMRGEQFPSVTLRFEISDVTIKVTLQNKSFLHFLTHICAIIGGVFVIFSLLSRILNVLFDACTEEKKN